MLGADVAKFSIGQIERRCRAPGDRHRFLDCL
jgi:hypothetical protein